MKIELEGIQEIDALLKNMGSVDFLMKEQDGLEVDKNTRTFTSGSELHENEEDAKEAAADPVAARYLQSLSEEIDHVLKRP